MTTDQWWCLIVLLAAAVLSQLRPIRLPRKRTIILYDPVLVRSDTDFDSDMWAVSQPHNAVRVIEVDE